MLGLLESLLVGACIGSVCGTCVGIGVMIIKDYNNLNIRKTDVEHITKNILPISDEEPDSKKEYMTARPII